MPSDDTKVDDQVEKSTDHDIGYGKPPTRSKFKKGQSGNPTGRRSGIKNLKTDLSEELQESVMVREGERATRISKQRAVVKTLVNKTLKGDSSAARTLLGTMNKLFDQKDDMNDAGAPLGADDVEVLEAFEKRLLARAKAAAGAGPFTADIPNDRLTAPVPADANIGRDDDVDEQR